MKIPHHLRCESPICNGDPNPNYKHEVLWYPGELVCKRGPFEPFQLQQLLINKEVKRGRFKNMDKAYTASELERDYLKGQRSKRSPKRWL